MDKLKNLTHIDDIETVDKEFYNAIKTVISENPIFESIMRPNIEAIYLPKGMKISENVASFAERYDIPILFKDATYVPKTAPSANLYASKVQITETPIQIQQRLIKELETAKNREDFSRITQEIKNLPKTEEYKAIRQRLGGEYLQRYNEWKADLPESIRSIINMATDKEVNNITKKSPNMQYLAELLCTKRFVCRQISENIVAGETFANKSIEDLKLLKDCGVKTVIDFREYDEDYKTMCEQIGLQYKSCPLIHIAGPSKQTLFSGKNNQNVSEDFVKNLKLLLDLTKQGSVYMGCNYGIDRTNFGITLVYMFSDSSDIYVPTILPSDMGSAKTLLNRNLDLIRKIVKRLNPQQREYLGLSDNIDESLNLKIKKITSKNQVPLPSTITQLIEEKLNNRK